MVHLGSLILTTVLCVVAAMLPAHSKVILQLKIGLLYCGISVEAFAIWVRTQKGWQPDEEIAERYSAFSLIVMCVSDTHDADTKAAKVSSS